EDEDVQRGHDDMVKAALPIKIRTRLELLLAPLPPQALDIARYVAACQRTADRTALALGGDPAAIARECAARGVATTHLISAIAHPSWLPLRARLGLG